VDRAAGVEGASLVGAEAASWDAVVLGMATKFLAAGLLTTVCSCC